MQWQDMTETQKLYTYQAMQRFGGGFVSRLAEAWITADTLNAGRLESAFADIPARYGPGTQFYVGHP